MKRINKYKNIRCEVDGHKFASKKEAQRYLELKKLKISRRVVSFEMQKAFPLNDYAKTKREQIKYICDFFVKWRNGKETVEDTKGYRTEVYKLKKKLFETKYGIKITEI